MKRALLLTCLLPSACDEAPHPDGVDVLIAPEVAPPRRLRGWRMEADVVPGAFLRGTLEVGRVRRGVVDCHWALTLRETRWLSTASSCPTCAWGFEVGATAVRDVRLAETGVPSSCRPPSVVAVDLFFDPATPALLARDGSGGLVELTRQATFDAATGDFRAHALRR